MSTSCSGLTHGNTLFSKAVYFTVTHVIVSFDSRRTADYNGDTEQCARTHACIKSALCARLSVPVLSSSTPHEHQSRSSSEPKCLSGKIMESFDYGAKCNLALISLFLFHSQTRASKLAYILAPSHSVMTFDLPMLVSCIFLVLALFSLPAYVFIVSFLQLASASGAVMASDLPTSPHQ